MVNAYGGAFPAWLDQQSHTPWGETAVRAGSCDGAPGRASCRRLAQDKVLRGVQQGVFLRYGVARRLTIFVTALRDRPASTAWQRTSTVVRR